MKYNIVSDLPGRLRIRCGANKIPFVKSYALTVFLEKLPHVEKAKVSHLTGSILLFFNKTADKKALLEKINQLEISKLETIDNPYENMALEIDEDFRNNVFRLLRNRMLRHFFLPVAWGHVFCMLNALRFIYKGANYLMQRKLTVEVLDATAISVSLLQKQFDTAGNIMFLLRFSELLESYTEQKAKNELTESLLINVDQVWLSTEEGEVSVPLSDVKIGDKIVVRTGSLIPADGEVVAGEALVNQASMTGEAMGVFRKAKDSVFAGTVVEDGSITIRIKALNKDSRINKIVEMIEHSEQLKASVQGKAERIADNLVPFSFLLSFGVYLLTRNVTKALSVLLVDYSCAIKLATPTAVISAMREASGHKIIVKGGKYLEAMAAADTIVFDKTGTLTVSTPSVSKVIPFTGFSREEVLRTAACLEEHFPHSVARAVVNKAKEENLRHEEEHTDVIYIAAHGIATTWKDQRTIIGSAHFVFEDEAVPLSDKQKNLIEENTGGDSVIFLAIGGKAAGFICITDPPRPEAASVVSALRKLGLKQIVMLTGDNASAARIVSKQMGMDWFRAQVLPEDKVKVIEELKANNHKVIMVGDGINDSPALAAADVSVSMCDASDIAREVADITLLTSDLKTLAIMRIISQNLMLRIYDNYRQIVGFNTALLLLGLGNVLTPSLSATLHNLSTLVITAKSTSPYFNKEEFEKIT